MNNNTKEIEDALKNLTGNINLGALHPLDEKRIVTVLWGLAKGKLLNEVDIPELAREKYHWPPQAIDFLKCADRVIYVLYPMVKSKKLSL